MQMFVCQKSMDEPGEQTKSFSLSHLGKGKMRCIKKLINRATNPYILQGRGVKGALPYFSRMQWIVQWIVNGGS